jgi:hypothetical protein
MLLIINIYASLPAKLLLPLPSSTLQPSRVHSGPALKAWTLMLPSGAATVVPIALEVRSTPGETPCVAVVVVGDGLRLVIFGIG